MPGNPQPIHRGAVAVAFAAAVAVTGGCSGRSPMARVEPVPGPIVLDALATPVSVLPGQSVSIGFRVHSEAGAAIAGQQVSFAIVDDAQGATLATDSVVSDDAGNAQTVVTAGLPTTFNVHAAAGTATADVMVLVSTAEGGTVMVAPFFAGASRAAQAATRVEVAFYDNAACSAISLVKLPASDRATMTLAVSGGAVADRARFNPVPTEGAYAIAARARDGSGAVRAAGCVDLVGATLVPGGTVQIALPLADTNPSPLGRYSVTSDFTFSPPLAAAGALAAPWVDLQDCPLDPAQLWLDCTIDALDGAPAGDPSDCVPGGHEGALADLLAARRGTPIVGTPAALPVSGAGACRAARDDAGVPSLDARVMGLLSAAPSALLAALPGVAADAGRILGAMRLRSELTIATTAAPDLYQATHRVDSVGLSLGTGTTVYDVALVPLGAPVLEADFISAVEDSTGALVLGTHGITLRLGTVARAAFSQLVLTARGLPPSSDALAGAIAALASGSAGGSGCAALDALLCAEAGRAPGCLGTACRDGLAALAARLDGGFAAADGAGIDFVLDSGSALLLDRHGSGQADRLGDRYGQPAQPGVWQADLHTAAGRASVSGVWEGERVGD